MTKQFDISIADLRYLAIRCGCGHAVTYDLSAPVTALTECPCCKQEWEQESAVVALAARLYINGRNPPPVKRSDENAELGGATKYSFTVAAG